jgi:predicted membrane-bound spermidine synthase
MKRFIPLIFVEGATVMTVELCGAKLLAPLFGSSLFVWASILAITLCALAAGYFYGGVLSRKENISKQLRFVLYMAACFTALMPFLAVYAIPAITFLLFQPAVIMASLLLIFLPVFFLGCTSPLFIRLHAQTVEQAGTISGQVYALSTMGGIISTFLCGFLLIPHFGLRATLLFFAFLLALTSSITLRGLSVNYLTVFVLAVAASLMSGSKSGKVLYSSHGIMGLIEVTEIETNGVLKRQLLVNKTVQTEMNMKNRKAMTGYVNLLDSIIPQKNSSEPSEALLLGLGGGLVANLLAEKGYHVTGVEFDQRIADAAVSFFFLNSRVKLVTQDARYFLNHSDSRFKMVIMDLFKAEEQPGYIISLESLQKLKTNLVPGGMVIVNWHGYLSEPYGKGTEVLLQTFTESGFKGESAATSSVEAHSNRVFVFRVNEAQVKHTGSALVNTDNRPLLELANARANLQWRKNYLRYWQQSE